MKRIYESSTAALRNVDILDLPDRFNMEFAEDGWIATSSLPVDVMKKALEHRRAGRSDQAEATILQWFTEDRIRLLAIQRGRSFNKARGRVDQLEEALTLTTERRYLSAVPLILIACDGFASDVLETSPFEKHADLTVFDSVVGHPTSLPALIGRLAKGVRKSSDQTLRLPLRHGILHGRSLGYGNEHVCYRAWMLMIAIVDWAIDKDEEEHRRQEQMEDESLTWRDVGARLQENAANRQAIDTFEPEEWENPCYQAVKEGEPPRVFWEFLNAWKTKNYGKMAHHAMNASDESHARLAGSIRRDAELVDLVEFKISTVRQTALSRSEAVVFMRGTTLRGTVEGRLILLAFRLRPDGTVAMAKDDGTWHVQQNCIFDLMHQPTNPAE